MSNQLWKHLPICRQGTCLHLCPYCHNEVDSTEEGEDASPPVLMRCYDEFTTHLRLRHKISRKRLKNLAPTCRITNETIKCRICDAKVCWQWFNLNTQYEMRFLSFQILYERRQLERHFREVHSEVTLWDYFRHTVYYKPED